MNIEIKSGEDPKLTLQAIECGLLKVIALKSNILEDQTLFVY